MPSETSNTMSGAGLPPAADARRLPLPEFVAILAVLFATVAFSIDAMLPALPSIAAEMVPDQVNRAQLVITAFMLGMGVGTLFVGPISDALGRKPVIAGGLAVYIAGALMASHAATIETLLAARCLQGIGAAGARIVGVAMVRDLYEGRQMARVTSFVMTVFIMFPAVAPTIGQWIIAASGHWNSIFYAFVVFGLIGGAWVTIRQPETLPRAQRRPMRPRLLWAAAREVLADGEVRIYTLVLTLGFGQMIGVISSAQQLFVDTYDKGASFTYWFAGAALVAGSASFLNARLVVRLGMRRIAVAAYAMQVGVSALMGLCLWTGLLPQVLAFPAFFLWVVSVFFMNGVTFGNLNALALQKMGHIAGMAASIVTAISTVGAVPIAAIIGQLYDGTARPLVTGVFLCSALALVMIRRTLSNG